jgi:hypothetical protein
MREISLEALGFCQVTKGGYQRKTLVPWVSYDTKDKWGPPQPSVGPVPQAGASPGDGSNRFFGAGLKKF